MPDPDPIEPVPPAAGPHPAPVPAPPPPAAAEPPAPEQGTPPEAPQLVNASGSKERTEYFAGIAALGVLLMVGFSVIGGVSGNRDYDVVATTRQEPGKPGGTEMWSVVGRVLKEGEPEAGVLVWAVASDGMGNRHSAPGKTTDESGTFTFEGIPKLLGSHDSKQPVRTIEVRARKSNPFYKGGDKKGETIIALESSQISRLIPSRQIGFLVAVPLLLFINLITLAVPSKTVHGMRRKFYCTIVATMATTLGMTLILGVGLLQFTSNFKSKEVIPLGFATIFEASCVEGQSSEWMISLTSPPNGAPPDLREAAVVPVPGGGTAPAPERKSDAAPKAYRGLGAPLWVVFLSVLGAALFAVTLVIKLLCDAPLRNSQNVEDYSKSIQPVVEHQFFLMFAPLGGIFLYQFLVLAKMAGEPVSVAVTILGAGTTLNLLLAKAVKLSSKAVGG